MEPEPQAIAGHFARYNAFVDGGHFGRLTLVQAAVWHTYEKHADAAGESCPSNDTLARAAGHRLSRHAREAREELVRMGYLERTGRIHPKYKTPIYRVTLPRIGAPCPDPGHPSAEPSPAPSPCPDSGHPAPNPGTVPRFRTSPCPDSAAHPAPNRGTKQLIQQLNQQKKRGAAAAAAAPAVAFPPELDTPEFRAAWGEWEAYRRRRRKTLDPATAARQLKGLAGLPGGVAAAIQRLDDAITNGWAGCVFPEDKHRSNGHDRRSSRAGRRAGEFVDDIDLGAVTVTVGGGG